MESRPKIIELHANNTTRGFKALYPNSVCQWWTTCNFQTRSHGRLSKTADKIVHYQPITSNMAYASGWNCDILTANEWGSAECCSFLGTIGNFSQTNLHWQLSSTRVWCLKWRKIRVMQHLQRIEAPLSSETSPGKQNSMFCTNPDSCVYLNPKGKMRHCGNSLWMLRSPLNTLALDDTK